jgi:hypothetical protein
MPFAGRELGRNGLSAGRELGFVTAGEKLFGFVTDLIARAVDQTSLTARRVASTALGGIVVATRALGAAQIAERALGAQRIVNRPLGAAVTREL